MRVLITGASGFVGRHLANHLLDVEAHAILHGTVYGVHDHALPESVQAHAIDLRDPSAVRALFEQVQPDQVYHVAAMAAVGRSFTAAWETLENNIRAQLNILEASLQLARPPRVLVVSSGEIYGAADDAHLPSDETAPFRPSSPYSVSKVTQDMLGLQYWLSHQLPVLRVRPFNHTGPGQSEGFVAPDFGMQIARIEAGQQEARLYVGSLSARRDFTDARDVVRAYRLVMNHGLPGEVYNVASGVTHSIQELLDTLIGYATTPVEICPDPRRGRPSSVPILWGDASKLRAATGWKPSISFQETLLDVLNDCRERVRRSRSSIPGNP